MTLRMARELALHGGALLLGAFVISLFVGLFGLPQEARQLLSFALGGVLGVALVWSFFGRNM